MQMSSRIAGPEASQEPSLRNAVSSRPLKIRHCLRMVSLEVVQQLLDGEGFFRTISRLAHDPAHKAALYMACDSLLQTSFEGQKALAQLVREARLAKICLCSDLNARPQHGLQSLVCITSSIFGHSQAATELDQYEVEELLHALNDLLRSTDDRVSVPHQPLPSPCTI